MGAWSNARTPEEVQANRRRILLGDEQGLVAYWRFTETRGSVAPRAAGRPKTAVLQGDASFTESTATPIEEKTPELPLTLVPNHGVRLH